MMTNAVFLRTLFVSEPAGWESVKWKLTEWKPCARRSGKVREQSWCKHKNLGNSSGKEKMGVEIERKFLVRSLPENLDKYPYHVIEQGYLNVRPAIRVRREDDIYYMTYKGEIVGSKDHLGLDNERFMDMNEEKGAGVTERIGKVEYNMALDPASYDHMLSKADGNIIRKKRYLIPINGDAFTGEYLKERPELTGMMESGQIKIELDVFDDPFGGMVIAEVEFPDEEAAAAYRPAAWFLEEATGDPKYSNAYMSSLPAELIGSIRW